MKPQSSRLIPPSAIHLHVDRFVVDESLLAGGRGGSLSAVVEAELARLLSERGLARISDAAIPSLKAPNIQVVPGPPSAYMGRQIAQAVYTAVGAASPPPREGGPKRGSR